MWEFVFRMMLKGGFVLRRYVTSYMFVFFRIRVFRGCGGVVRFGCRGRFS